MKKKLIIIISSVVILIAAAAILYFFVFKDKEGRSGGSNKKASMGDIKSLVKKYSPDNWEYSEDKVSVDGNSVSIIYNNVDDWVTCGYFTKDHVFNIANSNSDLLDDIRDITFICKNNAAGTESKAQYSNIDSITKKNYSQYTKYFDINGNEITESFESGFKNLAKPYTYKEIFRNPEDYISKKIKLTGEVVQVMEDTEDGVDYWGLRVDMTKDEWGYYDDTVMILIPKDAFSGRFIEDDIVTFYGICADTYTYETVLGATQTIPLILGVFAELSK